MSAVWRFFDLAEAMCQLCKAEVSGTAGSGEGAETWSTLALRRKKKKADARRPSRLAWGEMSGCAGKQCVSTFTHTHGVNQQLYDPPAPGDSNATASGAATSVTN